MNIAIGELNDQESICVDPTHEIIYFGKYSISMEAWRDINERVIAANHYYLIGSLISTQNNNA